MDIQYCRFSNVQCRKKPALPSCAQNASYRVSIIDLGH